MSLFRSRSIQNTHAMLGLISTEWDTPLEDTYARKYVLQYGVTHLVLVNLYTHATTLLCNERYLMTRLRVLNVEGVQRLCEEIFFFVKEDDSAPSILRNWERFFNKNRFLFERGTSAWSADRIFLQKLLECPDKKINSKSLAIAEEQDFNLIYTKPYTDLYTGKMLLDGYVEIDYGGVFFYDNRMVVWSRSKIGMLKNNQFRWGHSFEKKILSVGRGGDRLFVQFKNSMVLIDGNGEIEDYENGWNIEGSINGKILLSSEGRLLLKAPTLSQSFSLPTTDTRRQIFWDENNVVLFVARQEEKSFLWMLDIKSQQTIGPSVLEDTNIFSGYLHVWSDNGVLLWMRGRGTLFFVDKKARGFYIRLKHELIVSGLQEKIPFSCEDVVVENILQCKKSYVVQISDFSIGIGRNKTSILIEMSLDEQGVHFSLLYPKPIQKLIHCTSEEIVAILPNGTALLFINNDATQFVDSGLQVPTHYQKSRFDDSFFIIGDRSCAVFDRDKNRIQTFVLSSSLKPTFTFVNDVLHTNIVEPSKGVFLWWDSLNTWVHKVHRGWFWRINMASDLGSLLYTNRGITWVSINECLSFDERKEYQIASVDNDAKIKAKMDKELFLYTLEENDSSYALVSRYVEKQGSLTINEDRENIRIVDGNRLLVHSVEGLILYEIFPDGEIEEVWCVDYFSSMPELAYWVSEEQACLMIEDPSILDDDSLVVFLEGDGDHMMGSGNAWELLKSFPELFGLLLGRRTYFAAEGGALAARGKSSGTVTLFNNDETIPIHRRQTMAQWHTRGAVSVERILNKETIIVRCDDGFKELTINFKDQDMQFPLDLV